MCCEKKRIKFYYFTWFWSIYWIFYWNLAIQWIFSNLKLFSIYWDMSKWPTLTSWHSWINLGSHFRKEDSFCHLSNWCTISAVFSQFTLKSEKIKVRPSLNSLQLKWILGSHFSKNSSDHRETLVLKLREALATSGGNKFQREFLMMSTHNAFCSSYRILNGNKWLKWHSESKFNSGIMYDGFALWFFKLLSATLFGCNYR